MSETKKRLSARAKADLAVQVVEILVKETDGQWGEIEGVLKIINLLYMSDTLLLKKVC